MSIEKDIFKKSKVDYNKLLEYGFSKNNNQYTISKTILNNSFEVKITIDTNSNIKSKIYDLDTNLEYLNINVETTGTFSNKVKYEYIELLKDIKDKCFNEEEFIFEQTRRINKLITEKYNIKKEHLFEKYPSIAVYRNENKKWFSIIMNIDKSKITKGTGEIEIMNVKIDKKVKDDLLKQKGYYISYHMNKNSWITMILDDTLTDEEIMERIDYSYESLRK